jgi:beta-mannanase
VPASGSAYLGAFVDPSGRALDGATPLGGAGGVAAELNSLPGVEQGLGRPLSIVEVDQGWDVPVDAGQLGRVVATGAVPMITWECGDTDADVAAGTDDALITAFGRQLRALGAPVLVRWFPDPTATDSATQGCLGAAGASGYVAAFRHVKQLLVAAGATNAATVWSVDSSQGSGSEWAGFYPGPSSTDWIAADGYGPSAGPEDPGGLTTAFGSWYSTFSTYGKPLLISNTGVAPGLQSQFLRQVGSDLPSRYPLVKGLVYFDAPQEATQAQLALDGDGQAALRALSRAPYFQPARSPSATTITAPVTHVTAGQPVSITGSVDVPDHGGSVTYLSNGSALAGCSDLPVARSVGCDTSTLPVGTDGIVAAYSGDAAFEPSDSTPLSVVVVPMPADGTGPASPATSAPRVQAGPGPAVCGPVGPAPTAPSGPVHKPVVPGPCQTYLGASVDPSGTTESAALAALNQGAGRPVSIVQLDQTWNAPFNATQLGQVFATGAIPMVTWSCGDSDLKVANGTDDLTIAADARALASAGIPVLLRWFPDPGSVPSDTNKCLGKAGATGYVQAYREIVRQFRLAGAGNVGFVWTVDTNSPQSPATPWSAYYPGGGFVDWIGADGFDASSSPATADWVKTQFRAWYSEFAPSGKPLMISDTGAIAGPNHSLQATYLTVLGTALPSAFPLIKAVIYDDASDKVPPAGTVYDFALNPAGQSAFDSLSAGSYFQPVRSGTSTSVSVSDGAPPHGKVLVITATVSGSDLGGTVSFLDNGSPIAGCENVAVLNASSCETSSLAGGVNDIVADYLGDADYAPSGSTPVAVNVKPTAGLRGRPYIPPVGTAYLGAWVRPLPVGRLTPVDQELSKLPSFNSGLDRSLSVVHVYQDWATPTSLPTLQKVLASGATPMIDWRCGPSDADIIAGRDDALITNFATELAQLKAPIFLRWFYEFNFPFSPNYLSCIAGLGPAGYAAAFRHIHALFTAAGANNVAFVWCISAAGQDQDWIKYYPGPAYVDWIAVDGYLRNSATYTAGQFAQRFGAWYSTFASFGKPMMIAETAALSGAQAQYLSDVKNLLDNGYPMLRGLLYFDAPGKGGTYQYVLDASGYSEFQALANDRRFQPPVEASTTSLSVSTSSARQAEAVHISAKVVSDYGGSVSLYSNGTPVVGCQQLSIGAGSGCTTVSLPAGTDVLTATYNGDAEYAKSVSPPTSVQLAPLFTADPSAPPLFRLPGVPALGPFGVPLTATVSDRAALAPGSSLPVGPPNSLDLWGTLIGRRGFGRAAVLVGVLLMLVGGSYMLVTWVKDERLKRRLAGP